MLSFFFGFFPELQHLLLQLTPLLRQILVNRLVLASLDKHLNSISRSVSLLKSAYDAYRVPIYGNVSHSQLLDYPASFPVLPDYSAFDAFDVGFRPAENGAQVDNFEHCVFIPYQTESAI